MYIGSFHEKSLCLYQSFFLFDETLNKISEYKIHTAMETIQIDSIHKTIVWTDVWYLRVRWCSFDLTCLFIVCQSPPPHSRRGMLPLPVNGLCSVYKLPLSREGSLSCHTYYDTGLHFLRFYLSNKQWVLRAL